METTEKQQAALWSVEISIGSEKKTLVPSTPRAKKAPTQLNIKWNEIED